MRSYFATSSVALLLLLVCSQAFFYGIPFSHNFLKKLQQTKVASSSTPVTTSSPCKSCKCKDVTPLKAEALTAIAPQSEVSTTKPVHVVAVVPESGERSVSPLAAPWVEVMEHMNRRMGFVDPALSLDVVTEEDLASKGLEAMPSSYRPNILYFCNVQNEEIATILKSYLPKCDHIVSFNSSEALMRKTRIGPAHPYGKLAKIWRLMPFSRRKKLLNLYDVVEGFWQRGHSDDVLMSILVVVNAVITNIPPVSEIMKPLTFKALKCMVSNCLPQIIDCRNNPVCKAALACLDKCPPNDQICRYRCIVSYESKEFEQFALFVLQKHNCLGNHAAMPTNPDPAPITHFRGEALTHQMAEEISFAHLGELPWSWKVIAGQNPAYDFFPSQHMIYYRKGKQVWYQPVFKVTTFDGKEVWRRRLYRVRRGKTPGTFYYSVLDNGVTSSEYWRIIDVAEDLSWVLFYYTGAAAAAGQSYAGAILASPDGNWPPHKETYIARVDASLNRAGIKPWELFQVKHIGSEGAPLQIDPLAEPRFIYPRPDTAHSSTAAAAAAAAAAAT